MDQKRGAGQSDLIEQKTASRPFLRWLHKWIYGDTSAHAHLSPFGLAMSAQILLLKLLYPDIDLNERREFHIYQFLHFSRMMLAALAIATELNFYFKLNCDADVAFIWTIIQEFVPEGRDMFKQRYASMVSS